MSLDGPLLTAVKTFYLQNRTPGQWHCLYHRGAVLIPSSQVMTGLFFLLDSSFPSLPVMRETQHTPISIRCGSGASEPAMFGLREVGCVLHTPCWRHGSTSLIATWVAHSFLFDLGEVWAENMVFKVFVHKVLHAYQVFRSFWKEIVRRIKENDEVAYFLLSSCDSMRLNISQKMKQVQKISFWQVTFLPTEIQNLLQRYAAPPSWVKKHFETNDCYLLIT